MKQRGVEFSGGGTVEKGVTPSSARLVTDEEGEPLSRLILDMNKFSNNFIAETLAKDLGAFKSGKQGHMSDGLNAIRDFLEQRNGMEKLGLQSLANVSGFTRKNSFATQTICGAFVVGSKTILNFIRNILQSLPIAGVDGTLHKRMLSSETAGWVRAKTGLLNGVVALSGFAGRPRRRDVFDFCIHLQRGRG